MKKLLCLFVLLLCLVAPTWAATTTSTTLSAAVTTTSATSIRVTSATGFTAGSTYAFVGVEVMDVTAVNGLTISVMRGTKGTVAQPHNILETVYVGPSAAFVSWPTDPVGRCTSGEWSYLPLINVRTGSLISCSSSRWTAIQPSAGVYMPIGSQPFTINSRDYLNTANSSIGFQVKPNQAIGNTSGLIGGEISPRCASGIACASVTGLHVDAYLKGTAVGTISGSVRGIELEMVADDAGTRTISGDVSALRIRSAFSATTITGKFVPIRIEFPETQTNSKTYDAVFELTGTVPLVWNSAPGSEPSTADGYIKVLVNGAARYIQLYSSAPTD